MKEKFINYLDEEYTPIVEEAEKKRRGRPKKTADDADDSGKEGVRDVKLDAKIKIGKKTETATKILKDFPTDKLDAEVKKFEKELHKKYKYEADDVIITKHIGNYEVEDKSEQHMTKDSEGSEAEDDTYSIGRREK